MKQLIPIGIIVACLVGMLIVPVIAVGLALSGGGGTSCTPTAAASTDDDANSGGSNAKGGNVNGVPSKFIPIYQEAAAKYRLGEDGPSMLAGLHYSETNFSTNIATSGPYVGPMAHGTAFWGTFGVDGDGDGEKDIMNDADAIFAAAALLKEYGAPGNWRDAMASYKAGPANIGAGYGFGQIAIDFANEHHVPADENASGGGSTSTTTASNECVCETPAATTASGSSALSSVFGATVHAASGGKPFLLGDSIGVGLKPELGGWSVEATGAISLPASFEKADARKDDIRSASVVVIELGTNPTDNFESDAKKMVRKIKSYNSSAPIYWVQIFSHGSGADADYSSQNRIIENLDGVTVIKTIDKRIELQSDNIHPDAKGYQQLADIIKAAVRSGSSGSSGGSSTGGGATATQNCDDSGGGGSVVSGECKANRLAYTTPYHEAELTQVFGRPGEGGAGQHLKTVQVLGGSVQVHEKLAPCLESVEQNRKAKGIDYVQSPSKGGIGGYRATDGQIGNDSYHVYGAAIDVNSETNPYCNGGTVVGNPDYCDNPEIPMELVKVFRDHGFYWGGDYNSLKDYMHFEWHGEKA